jgi:hypothetical protein
MAPPPTDDALAAGGAAAVDAFCQKAKLTWAALHPLLVAKVGDAMPSVFVGVKAGFDDAVARAAAAVNILYLAERGRREKVQFDAQIDGVKREKEKIVEKAAELEKQVAEGKVAADDARRLLGDIQATNARLAEQLSAAEERARAAASQAAEAERRARDAENARPRTITIEFLGGPPMMMGPPMMGPPMMGPPMMGPPGVNRIGRFLGA